MSRPGTSEVQQLEHLAEELREMYSERSYRIDAAVEMDRAFDVGDVRSSLERALVLRSLSKACGRVGVDFRTANGSGRELRFASALIDRRYRVRRAKRRADGELMVPVSSDAALAQHNDGLGDPTLFDDAIIDNWTLLWLLSPDRRTVEEVLAADVVGYIEGHPGRLQFGTVISLGGEPASPPEGFKPADEDLDLGDGESQADAGDLRV